MADAFRPKSEELEFESAFILSECVKVTMLVESSIASQFLGK